MAMSKNHQYYDHKGDEINGRNEMIKKGKNELERSILDNGDEKAAEHHPFNSEPLLSRLMHHGFLTPVPLHYVRNHGPVPETKWEDWTVEVTGLVEKPTRFTMDQLVNKFQFRELPVTLVSAGNRRKEQNMTKQTRGFNGGRPAAKSTSIWRGVPLTDLLNGCGLISSKEGVVNVCFEGADNLPSGDGSKYGTSVPIERAMDPARDIMLAYMQNGEPLAHEHGFPVRLIIPGVIGSRSVKWLKRIIVTTIISDDYKHYKDNRVLPSDVDAELANSKSWWYKPEFIISDLNVNSVITTPCHEEILPISASATRPGIHPYTLKGYAYSGGGKKVIRVEVTMDGGETWKVAELDHQEIPTKYGKYWCWCFWSFEIELLDFLDDKEIAVRAWDETFNTQPRKLTLNSMGMVNNCWFRVKTNMCKPYKGELRILFKHATQPGNKPGGWMADGLENEAPVAISHALKRSKSTPTVSETAKMYSASDVKSYNY